MRFLLYAFPFSAAVVLAVWNALLYTYSQSPIHIGIAYFCAASSIFIASVSEGRRKEAQQ